MSKASLKHPWPDPLLTRKIFFFYLFIESRCTHMQSTIIGQCSRSITRRTIDIRQAKGNICTMLSRAARPKRRIRYRNSQKTHSLTILMHRHHRQCTVQSTNHSICRMRYCRIHIWSQAEVRFTAAMNLRPRVTSINKIYLNCFVAGPSIFAPPQAFTYTHEQPATSFSNVQLMNTKFSEVYQKFPSPHTKLKFFKRNFVVPQVSSLIQHVAVQRPLIFASFWTHFFWIFPQYMKDPYNPLDNSIPRQWNGKPDTSPQHARISFSFKYFMFASSAQRSKDRSSLIFKCKKLNFHNLRESLNKKNDFLYDLLDIFHWDSTSILNIVRTVKDTQIDTNSIVSSWSGVMNFSAFKTSPPRFDASIASSAC